MKYMVRKSYVYILGTLWMPGITASMIKELDTYDVGNIKEHGAGIVNREAVERWLLTHSGDFQNVIDFSASIEDGENTIDIPWSKEENEFEFNDTQYPVED